MHSVALLALAHNPVAASFFTAGIMTFSRRVYAMALVSLERRRSRDEARSRRWAG